MKLIKQTLLTLSAFLLLSLPLSAADLNIATLDPQAALFSTNVAKQELEELENSDEWKERSGAQHVYIYCGKIYCSYAEHCKGRWYIKKNI